NVQLDLGMTTLGEDGMPSTRVSLEVGVTRLKEPGATLNSTEVALGGRLYGGVLNARTPMGGPTLPIQPFGLAQALLSFFDRDGVDLGTQVGGRFGGGLQFALSDQAFFDMIVDYTIPFVEGNLGPLETEYSGLALRLGLGITF
ncbi:MAG: hypothetical protein P8M11_03755, partial [Planctomycetota bacterium]|nr:hypothetical protein [Planctomycetota bacterium]